jgi:uncharacterized protein (TIGR01777 family)
MNVLVSGSSGLVGSALVSSLKEKGHAVRRLVREGGDEHDVSWRPERGEVEARRLADLDAVVHLAGESIASGRWTALKKAAIRDSRVVGTRLLCDALARQAKPPKVVVSASAVGFYGADRGEEWLDESSSVGHGFLADVCREWESATRPAIDAGVRVVHARLGFVLSARGGGLARMLPPFRLGVGGVVGSGRQYVSWVALDDVVGAIEHALTHASLRGPANVVAPSPVTNREFTKTLGRVVGRPTLVPMPTFAARLAFGEMADELLLGSQRVRPAKLESSGYAFRWPNLEEALRHAVDAASASH